jgi:hypothetical protein
MLSVAFMSRARARKVVEYGMDPIADLFEASVLPIVYESLQTGLGDLIKSALKSAAAAVVHALKSKNQTHERLIVSLTEREIKQLVKSVRSKAKSLGLKNEAVDALAGVLTHKLLMAK